MALPVRKQPGISATLGKPLSEAEHFAIGSGGFSSDRRVLGGVWIHRVLLGGSCAHRLATHTVTASAGTAPDRSAAVLRRIQSSRYGIETAAPFTGRADLGDLPVSNRPPRTDLTGGGLRGRPNATETTEGLLELDV